MPKPGPTEDGTTSQLSCPRGLPLLLDALRVCRFQDQNTPQEGRSWDPPTARHNVPSSSYLRQRGAGEAFPERPLAYPAPGAGRRESTPACCPVAAGCPASPRLSSQPPGDRFPVCRFTHLSPRMQLRGGGDSLAHANVCTPPPSPLKPSSGPREVWRLFPCSLEPLGSGEPCLRRRAVWFSSLEYQNTSPEGTGTHPSYAAVGGVKLENMNPEEGGPPNPMGCPPTFVPGCSCPLLSSSAPSELALSGRGFSSSPIPHLPLPHSAGHHTNGLRPIESEHPQNPRRLPRPRHYSTTPSAEGGPAPLPQAHPG